MHYRFWGLKIFASPCSASKIFSGRPQCILGLFHPEPVFFRLPTAHAKATTGTTRNRFLAFIKFPRPAKSLTCLIPLHRRHCIRCWPNMDFLFVCKPDPHALLYEWVTDFTRTGHVETLEKTRWNGQQRRKRSILDVIHSMP